MLKKLLILMLPLLITSCGGDSKDTKEKEFFVGDFVSHCQTITDRYCLKYNEDDGNERVNLFEKIDGFDYQVGYKYQLKILQTKINNPPADGSSYKYKLLEKSSETLVEEPIQYGIDLFPSGIDFLNVPIDKAMITSWSSSSIILQVSSYSNVNLSCENNPDACKAVYDNNELGHFNLLIINRVIEDETVRFEVDSLNCSANKADFISICRPLPD